MRRSRSISFALTFGVLLGCIAAGVTLISKQRIVHIPVWSICSGEKDNKIKCPLFSFRQIPATVKAVRFPDGRTKVVHPGDVLVCEWYIYAFGHRNIQLRVDRRELSCWVGGRKQ